MSQTYLFLPPDACAGAQAELPVQRVEGDDSQRMGFADALADLSGPWTLVLPVEAVTACAVRLPTQKARWLRQALPFAVEELLAEDVEQMHLALGEVLADGRHRVFAVRRAWLADWLALCPQPPQAIAVDADLLPREGTQLLYLESRWLLGGADVARMALAAEGWAALQAICPHPHVVYRTEAMASPEPADASPDVDDGYRWLARQPLVVNLAQAEFVTEQNDGRGRRWRPLVGLLGLWLVLQWGFDLAQGWYVQRQAEEYAGASAALYQELFPEDTRLVNLRAQLDQHLSAAGASGQGQLLGLLASINQAILAEGSQVQVQQVDYSSTRGDLALQVQASGFEALEQLRTRLQDAGLAVQMGSASRESAGVSARLVIGG